MISISKRKLYKVSNKINTVPAEDRDSNKSDFPKTKEEFLKLEYKMAFERDSQFMSARIIVKGWCITILAGIFSFLYKNCLFSGSRYFIIFCMVILFFYLVEVELAAYQKFCIERIVFIEEEMDEKKERIIKEKIPNFFGKHKDKRALKYFGNSIFSPTIVFFYSLLYLISALSWLMFSSGFSLLIFAPLPLFTILVLLHRMLLNTNRDNPGLMGIKSRYLYFVVVLLLLLFFLILMLRELLELQEWITVSATLGTVFAASLAGIIALAVADKPSRYVKFAVKRGC